jgi:hypothetical protein
VGKSVPFQPWKKGLRGLIARAAQPREYGVDRAFDLADFRKKAPKAYTHYVVDSSLEPDDPLAVPTSFQATRDYRTHGARFLALASSAQEKSTLVQQGIETILLSEFGQVQLAGFLDSTTNLA